MKIKTLTPEEFTMCLKKFKKLRYKTQVRRVGKCIELEVPDLPNSTKKHYSIQPAEFLTVTNMQLSYLARQITRLNNSGAQELHFCLAEDFIGCPLTPVLWFQTGLVERLLKDLVAVRQTQLNILTQRCI